MNIYIDTGCEAYGHGGNVLEIAKALGKDYSEMLDFSANLNPFGMPERIINALKDTAVLNGFYPGEAQERLRERLAESLGLPVSCIELGAGAAELIFRLVHAIGRPVRAMVQAPGFAEYERAVRSVYGSEIVYAKSDENLRLDESCIEKLEGIDMVFLCVPNNPSGLIPDIAWLEDFIEECSRRNVILVIDECFIDFVKRGERYSSKHNLAKYYNLIILGSFTKLYAIPGVRLGYLLSRNEELMYRMKICAPAWNIPAPAAYAGLAALEGEDLLSASEERERLVSMIETEKSILKSELEKLGMRVYPGRANYLLFFCERDKELYNKLLKNGIIIRDCSNFKGLSEGYYRVCVRTGVENTALIEALRRIKEEEL